MLLPGHIVLSDTERLSMKGYDTLVINASTLLLSLVTSKNIKKQCMKGYDTPVIDASALPRQPDVSRGTKKQNTKI